MGDMENQALYYIIFEDSTFVGGNDYYQTKWLEIPNKKIKRIFYRLPDGNHLCLSGYDEYYHMIEATQDITGKNRGKTNIEYAYIMGKRGRVVTSYRITLLNKLSCHSGDSRYKLGDIVRRDFDIDHKKIKGLNPKGWK